MKTRIYSAPAIKGLSKTSGLEPVIGLGMMPRKPDNLWILFTVVLYLYVVEVKGRQMSLHEDQAGTMLLQDYNDISIHVQKGMMKLENSQGRIQTLQSEARQETYKLQFIINLMLARRLPRKRRRWPNVDLLMGQRCRHSANNKSTLSTTSVVLCVTR